MRIFRIILCLICVSSASAFAQKSNLKFGKQHYFEGIEQAKTENKFFLMYVYQNGCEYCKELEKTFADKNLFAFLKEKFVLAKHNVKSKYGTGLAIDFKLGTTPALIIQNPNADKPVIIYGVKKPEELQKELLGIIIN